MFEAIGDRPQWQVVYEYLAGMSIGELVKDDELVALLPDAAEASIPSAFHRAVREIEDSHKRTFARVRNVGYRMVEATEHEGLARQQHKKAKRRMGAAWRKVHSADRSLLDPDQRRRIDAVEDHIGRQQEMIRRLEARQDNTDARVARTEKESQALTDRIDRLSELLQRHGISAESPLPVRPLVERGSAVVASPGDG